MTTQQWDSSRKTNMIQRYHSNEKNRGPKIDIWKQPKKVLYAERELGKNFLQVSIEINQPILSDGRDGFYQMSTSIKFNNHYIRLSPVAIIELMDILEYNRDKIIDAATHVREQNDIIRNEPNHLPRRRRQREEEEKEEDQY